MTDAFAGPMFLCVVAICVTFLIWDARRQRVAKSAVTKLQEQVYRASASLQTEALERGKLSRRLAQAETKIARLQKAHDGPVGSSPDRGK